MQTNTTVALKPNFMSSLLFCAVSLNTHFFQSLLNFKIFMIKIPKYLLFIFFVSNAVFIPICLVKAVRDDISTKATPI